jgi:hypothetical protein
MRRGRIFPFHFAPVAVEPEAVDESIECEQAYAEGEPVGSNLQELLGEVFQQAVREAGSVTIARAAVCRDDPSCRRPAPRDSACTEWGVEVRPKHGG